MSKRVATLMFLVMACSQTWGVRRVAATTQSAPPSVSQNPPSSSAATTATFTNPLLGVFPGLGSGKFGSPSSFTLSPPYFLNEAAAPLKRDELPSLMITYENPTLDLLVNTTKKP